MAYDNDERFAFLTKEEIDGALPISIGLAGGSGTGKTYTALTMASGIADQFAGAKGAPIAFVDTENRRALHYRRQFPQIGGSYVDFGPYDQKGAMIGYPPERWIALIDMIEASGVRAGVIDSFSHGWEGINGVLDLQAAELERLVEAAQARCPGRQIDPNQHSQLAWASIKPRYRRLINRIIRSKVNWIICTRAKPVMQKYDREARKEVNARKTKTRRADVPWDVAADGDLIFEMTAMTILDPDHPGCPRFQIKVADQFKTLFRPDVPLSYEVGKAMAEWSIGSADGAADKALMDAARVEARKGRAAMSEWWKRQGAQKQQVLQVIRAELQEIADKADAATTEDDPFDLTADQRAEAERAEAEVRAARRAEAEAAA